MNITVVRQPDELTEWQWGFWYYDSRHALVLDWYKTSTRPTKRHKFRLTEAYSRLNYRFNTLQERDVVMYPDVIQEAIDAFTKELRVVRWSEIKR